MITLIKLNEAEKWDEIVKSFHDYDIYYLSGYAKAFHIHGDGEPLLVYYQEDDLRAMKVVLKRDISMDERFKGKIEPESWFDFATPYGYGGFIFEGSITEEGIARLNETYTETCSNNHIVSEFVRFHPIIKNAGLNRNIYEITDLGSTISIDLRSKDQIWKNFTDKNRNVIRKAINAGVEIYWGRDPKLLEEFIPLYNFTMAKDGATPYYYFDQAFYDSILHDLKHHFLFFYAVFEGKIISMSIILFTNQKMHYHLSASDRNYSHLAATNLLIYEAALWGCVNGYSVFHLGGGLGSADDNLYKFKKAFNKHSESLFSMGKRIYLEDKYQELVNLRKPVGTIGESSAFFPEYRK